MKDLLYQAAEKGRSLGANFVDLRLETTWVEGVSAEDGQPKEAGTSLRKGVGVRALAGGSWGFAAADLEDPVKLEAIVDVVERAVKLARGTKAASKPMELAPVKAVEDTVPATFKLDPRNIPLEEKITTCVEASRRVAKFNSAITKSASGIATVFDEKTYCSSEGTCVTQSCMVVHGWLYAAAKVGDTAEFYMHTEAGAKGYELLRDYDLTAHAEEIAGKAVELASAKPAPHATLPVILNPEFVALLIHEIIGHPSEADRVAGKEAAWAGRAWWVDKVGEKLFSEKLTVVSDATLPAYFGSFRYDDEGVPAKRVVHVDRGVLKEFLHSRETARMFNVEPNGGMRASSYLFAPLIRMTNTYAEGGNWTLEDMLADVKEGVYLCGEKVPSIDSRRYNFQISSKEAYLIKNGEITEPLRSATLTGTSPEFLGSIDAVGRDVKIFPIPNCGKGDPMQTMRVGNGGPHIRGYGRVTGPKG